MEYELSEVVLNILKDKYLFNANIINGFSSNSKDPEKKSVKLQDVYSIYAKLLKICDVNHDFNLNIETTSTKVIGKHILRCLRLEDLDHLAPKLESLTDKNKISKLILSLDNHISRKYGKSTSQQIRKIMRQEFVSTIRPKPAAFTEKENVHPPNKDEKEGEDSKDVNIDPNKGFIPSGRQLMHTPLKTNNTARITNPVIPIKSFDIIEEVSTANINNHTAPNSLEKSSVNQENYLFEDIPISKLKSTQNLTFDTSKTEEISNTDPLPKNSSSVSHIDNSLIDTKLTPQKEPNYIPSGRQLQRTPIVETNTFIEFDTSSSQEDSYKFTIPDPVLTEIENIPCKNIVSSNSKLINSPPINPMMNNIQEKKIGTLEETTIGKIEEIPSPLLITSTDECSSISSNIVLSPPTPFQDSIEDVAESSATFADFPVNEKDIKSTAEVIKTSQNELKQNKEDSLCFSKNDDSVQSGITLKEKCNSTYSSEPKNVNKDQFDEINDDSTTSNVSNIKSTRENLHPILKLKEIFSVKGDHTRGKRRNSSFMLVEQDTSLVQTDYSKNCIPNGSQIFRTPPSGVNTPNKSASCNSTPVASSSTKVLNETHVCNQQNLNETFKILSNSNPSSSNKKHQDSSNASDNTQDFSETKIKNNESGLSNMESPSNSLCEFSYENSFAIFPKKKSSKVLDEYSPVKEEKSVNIENEALQTSSKPLIEIHTKENNLESKPVKRRRKQPKDNPSLLSINEDKKSNPDKLTELDEDQSSIAKIIKVEDKIKRNIDMVEHGEINGTNNELVESDTKMLSNSKGKTIDNFPDKKYNKTITEKSSEKDNASDMYIQDSSQNEPQQTVSKPLIKTLNDENEAMKPPAKRRERKPKVNLEQLPNDKDHLSDETEPAPLETNSRSSKESQNNKNSDIKPLSKQRGRKPKVKPELLPIIEDSNSLKPVQLCKLTEKQSSQLKSNKIKGKVNISKSIVEGVECNEPEINIKKTRGKSNNNKSANDIIKDNKICLSENQDNLTNSSDNIDKEPQEKISEKIVPQSSKNKTSRTKKTVAHNLPAVDENQSLSINKKSKVISKKSTQNSIKSSPRVIEEPVTRKSSRNRDKTVNYCDISTPKLVRKSSKLRNVKNTSVLKEEREADKSTTLKTKAQKTTKKEISKEKLADIAKESPQNLKSNTKNKRRAQNQQDQTEITIKSPPKRQKRQTQTKEKMQEVKNVEKETSVKSRGRSKK